MVAERKDLHELIDALPDSEVPTARRYLRYLRLISTDRVLRAFLDAPEDDEPVTEDDIARLEQAEEEMARGEVETWSQVKRQLKAER